MFTASGRPRGQPHLTEEVTEACGGHISCPGWQGETGFQVCSGGVEAFRLGVGGRSVWLEMCKGLSLRECVWRAFRQVSHGRRAEGDLWSLTEGLGHPVAGGEATHRNFCNIKISHMVSPSSQEVCLGLAGGLGVTARGEAERHCQGGVCIVCITAPAPPHLRLPKLVSLPSGSSPPLMSSRHLGTSSAAGIGGSWG